MSEAQRLLHPGTHVADHQSALNVALDYGISAYDARFLAIADRLGLPLITEDTKLRRAAPELTQSLEQALAAYP